MAWVDLSGAFAFGSVLTSTQMQNLRDNIAAMAAGDSGAPEIVEAALIAAVSGQLVTNGDTHNHSGGDGNVIIESSILNSAVTESKIASLAVTESKIASLAVTESKIASLAVTESKIASLAVTESKIASLAVTVNKIGSQAVAQSRLKSTTGTLSTTSTTGVYLVTPGGEYGFFIQYKTSDASEITYWGARSTGNAEPTGRADNTTYVSNVYISTSINTNTASLRQRYIQASPPYDLGHGDISLFIFLKINSTGKIESSYIAPEAPWHYSGPTKIGSEFEIKGKPHRRQLKALVDYNIKVDLKNPAMREKILFSLSEKEYINVEITQELKNRDMDLIPHPFMQNDNTGKSIVMLEPTSDLIDKLALLHSEGEPIEDIIHGDYLRLDNVPLNIGAHSSVKALSVRWKNT